MKTKKKQKTLDRRTAPRRTAAASSAKLPFIEHLYELRRRLYYIGISVLVGAVATYGVQQHIVAILLRPAKGEPFIYTSPGGGIDFLFRICIYSGLICSLPVIIYNSLCFLEPLIRRTSWRFIVWGSIASGLLAIAGMLFGYFLGLPAALHFLMHQFTTVQIKPLVTIQSYLGFVIVYMVGSALLFQLPLILLFINRIKPLRAKRLLHYERWVILAAFVLSGLMNPTPNIISQLLVAGPFIIVYQVGILLIALLNRSRKIDQLYQHDLQVQASRHARVPALESVALTPSITPSTPTSKVRSIPVIPIEAISDGVIAPPSHPATTVRPAPGTRPVVRPLARSQLYANRERRLRPAFDPSAPGLPGDAPR